MAGGRARTRVVTYAVALVLSSCGTPADPAPRAGSTGVPAPAAVSLTVGAPAWVSVSVTTLWRRPSSPRPVDAPALARPARIREWLATMTLAQRRGLNGRADSQALMGDRVRVVRLRPGWVKVVVPDQPTPIHRRGYPGWVPRRQLTATPPVSAAHQATVVTRTTWLRTDDESVTRVTPIGLGTRLPLVGTVARFVRVSTPDGAVRRIPTDAVRVHEAGAAALPATRRSLVRTARGLVGLDYLWAGRSGFGVDCSGLTSLDHRLHGVVIPRDAGPQAAAGRGVSGDLRRGDLLFYATGGVVHHVSMYAGRGLMVHAPGTGHAVQVIAVSTPAYVRELVGARRYLTP